MQYFLRTFTTKLDELSKIPRKYSQNYTKYTQKLVKFWAEFYIVFLK